MSRRRPPVLRRNRVIEAVDGAVPVGRSGTTRRRWTRCTRYSPDDEFAADAACAEAAMDRRAVRPHPMHGAVHRLSASTQRLTQPAPGPGAAAPAFGARERVAADGLGPAPPRRVQRLRERRQEQPAFRRRATRSVPGPRCRRRTSGGAAGRRSAGSRTARAGPATAPRSATGTGSRSRSSGGPATDHRDRPSAATTAPARPIQPASASATTFVQDRQPAPRAASPA